LKQFPLVISIILSVSLLLSELLSIGLIMLYRIKKWESLVCLKSSCCVAVASTHLLASPGVRAQLVPDDTLGTESSVVTSQEGRDLITGGAKREGNLFHSFQDFNVGNQQQVYFANPQDVTSIITRVTGKNVSNILGTLGIDGAANLFLINPNGIIFGSNASLDLAGSFVASTADGIRLGEDGIFSATEPDKSVLLTIQPGVLFSNALRQQQAEIRNQGNLAVGTGQRLTLQGDIVTSTGSLTAPGGRVEVLAKDILIQPGGTLSGQALSQSLLANHVVLQANNDIAVNDDITGITTNNLTMLAGRSLTIGNNRSILLNGGNFSTKINDEDPRFNKRDAEVGQFVMNPGSRIVTNGGNINISSQENITTGLLDTRSDVGKGGDITITGSAIVTTDNLLTDSPLQGGNILLEADSISVNNNITTNSRFQAGDISLNATGDISFSADTLNENGNITSIGDAPGKIELTSGGIISVKGTRILNAIQGSGTAKDISIKAGSVVVENGSIIALTLGEGQGGNMLIDAVDEVVLRHGSLATNANVGSSGNAGNFTLNAKKLHIIREPGLPSPFGVGIGTKTDHNTTGHAGDVTIKATESIEITGVRPVPSITSVEQLISLLIQDSDVGTGITTSAQGSGNSGNLRINTGRLVARDGIMSTFPVEGEGKDITIEATEIFLQGLSSIGTGTLYKDAGDLTINADTVTLTDGAALGASTFGFGNAGNLTLSVGQLNIRNGSFVGSTTVGQGKSGTTTVTASDVVEVVGTSADGTIPSGITTGSFTNASGDAGLLNITANRLVVKQRGEISTASFGQGAGGDIQINTRTLLLDRGRINASTATSQRGGNITIRALESVELVGSGFDTLQQQIVIPALNGTLSINNFDQGIVAITAGSGAAGNVFIETPNFIIRNGGAIGTTTLAQGQGGNITINTSDTLELDNSFIATGTFTDALSGNVDLTAPKLIARGGAQVFTTTFGSGKAGNLTVNVLDSIDLIDPNNEGTLLSSGLFASSAQTASGNGGDININIPTGNLTMIDGATASVSAEGQGNAGNINIDASSIVLNRGAITATGTSGKGGNINIKVANDLILRNNSQISTRAGTQESGGGNGGDININAKFIVAVPKEDSDITANAFEGMGGNINISAFSIFGLGLSGKPTSNSDISASSQLGIDGTIDISTLNIDPSKGLTQVPSNLTDSASQIVAGCATESANSFVVTGRGGLPENPTQYLQGKVIVQDTRNRLPGTQVQQPRYIHKHQDTSELVEARGWVVDKNGTVILTAEPSATNLQSSRFSSLSFDILPCLKGEGIPNITAWAFSFYESAYSEEFPHQNRGRSLQRR
jgi:filamentous hemagglutinin family protein